MQLFARDPHGGLAALTERVLLTLWVGGMWAVGYLAAPVLFYTLSDRILAGTLAGRMFSIINYIGLAAGLWLLLSGWLRRRSGAWPTWQLGALACMLVCIAIIQFGLQPVMAELRAQAAAAHGVLPPRFGQLHGLSSALYLVASLLGLVLVATRGGARRT